MEEPKIGEKNFMIGRCKNCAGKYLEKGRIGDRCLECYGLKPVDAEGNPIVFERPKYT